jgi:hypothetical protein
MGSFVSTLVIFAIGAAAAAPAAPSLDWIVEQHTRARGGRAAIEAVRAVQMDITIAEPTYTADGRYVATRDGSMRIDVFIDGNRVFTEALDHGRVWSRPAGETAAAVAGTTSGAAALRHGVEAPFKLFGMHEMQARGHRLKFAGRSVLDGTDYYVIEATLDDGYRTSYYLSPTTWLVERERQYRALHVDADPTPEWIETRFEDYRDVAGVQYPWRQVERQLATGKVLTTTSVKDILVNPPLDPALFVGPVGQ